MRLHNAKQPLHVRVVDNGPRLIWMMLLPLVSSLGCCVKEGTLIDTPDGKVPVEQIQVGQTVYSQDSAGRQVESCVTGVKKSIALGYLEIENDSVGQPLCVTAWHPVKTPNGWTRAGSLATGGRIQTTSGQQPIENIRLVPKLCHVFDLSVKPHRNFIANGVVVHNKSIAAPPTREQIIDVWYAIHDRSQQYSVMRYQFLADGTVKLARTYWKPNEEPTDPFYYTGRWSLENYTLTCKINDDQEDETDTRRFGSFEAEFWWSHFKTIKGQMGENQITLHRESAIEDFLDKAVAALELLGTKRQSEE